MGAAIGERVRARAGWAIQIEVCVWDRSKFWTVLVWTLPCGLECAGAED